MWIIQFIFSFITELRINLLQLSLLYDVRLSLPLEALDARSACQLNRMAGSIEKAIVHPIGDTMSGDLISLRLGLCDLSHRSSDPR